MLSPDGAFFSITFTQPHFRCAQASTLAESNTSGMLLGTHELVTTFVIMHPMRTLASSVAVQLHWTCSSAGVLLAALACRKRVQTRHQLHFHTQSVTGRVCSNGRRPLLLAPQYTWGMEAHAFGEPGSLEYQLMFCRKGARQPSDTPVHFPSLGLGFRAGAARGAAESPTHEHMDHEDYLLCSEL